MYRLRRALQSNDTKRVALIGPYQSVEYELLRFLRAVVWMHLSTL